MNKPALRLVLSFAMLAAPALAQGQATVTYDFVNVLMTPDISHPNTTATYP